MAEERNPLHLPHHKEEDKEGEEKQHGHDHGHGHGHGHNHNHNQTEHAAGRGVDMDLPAYVNMGSFTTAGVLDWRYQKATGEKRPDKVIGLISAEQAKEAERREAGERKAEEEEGGAAWAKNKNVYQF
ncbi:hypothetical protein CFC21_094529 [Triticum aestivum]|uniref:Uncharacterized protein n=3 Tax=Triticinae TaxID=1648030 RepID=A0A453Q0W8_AEGTS|nr:homeotic protein female sterile-like [Triticum aestivum]XP_045086085.1 homeotic protein female sterile-like [Aegilops tauschii subsp. strangulata]KAF7091998.1 hypothetical protein CFC21_094529 [Triticum aestivum]